MGVSFRGRLTLFFLLIVVLPMIAVAVLVVNVTGESRNGKADARLAEALEVAEELYADAGQEAERVTREIAADPVLAAALRSEDARQVELEARRLAGAEDVETLEITAPDGRELASIGRGPAVAPFEAQPELDGRPLGSMRASVTSATGYLLEVRRITGREAALVRDGEVVSATLGIEGVELPGSGESDDVDVGDQELRAGAVAVESDGLRVALFVPRETGGFFASSPLIAVTLAAFFAVALLFIGVLLRALQGHVTTMLDAARRIGGGDFSREVPVVGRDEMAGLASEFNKMSGRLEEQMDALRRQRTELESSVRRIGEAFASGLDRQALLEIIAETALTACGADYALIALRGPAAAEAESGEATEDMQEVAVAAEERAMRTLGGAEVSTDGFHFALASPLPRIGSPGESLGVMTVVRRGEPFSDEERDVFLYLIGQTSASAENIALHELVTEQAVTDELTGLANDRAFRELIEKEAARAERFGHHLSLLMLDIDDFKQVNDTHGHLQGDEVLRMIGRVLRSEARAVDEPARYGGEEFALALPETDVDGAVQFAERIRQRIGREQVARVGDDVGPLHVTASIGAASIPASAGNVQELIAAADAALYEAKRAGKNRVERAPARGDEPQPTRSERRTKRAPRPRTRAAK
jgi:diguanylate cyclase (GGDEF)-like protein